MWDNAKEGELQVNKHKRSSLFLSRENIYIHITLKIWSSSIGRSVSTRSRALSEILDLAVLSFPGLLSESLNMSLIGAVGERERLTNNSNKEVQNRKVFYQSEEWVLKACLSGNTGTQVTTWLSVVRRLRLLLQEEGDPANPGPCLYDRLRTTV